jgi:hypothetical protein
VGAIVDSGVLERPKVAMTMGSMVAPMKQCLSSPATRARHFLRTYWRATCCIKKKKKPEGHHIKLFAQPEPRKLRKTNPLAQEEKCKDGVGHCIDY